jgi:hypothetical protein
VGRPQAQLDHVEDLWNGRDFWPDRRYRRNPAAGELASGAEDPVQCLGFTLASGQNRVRHAMLASLAAKLRRPLVYCNLVGGNDELIFDGASLAFDHAGGLVTPGRRVRRGLCVARPRRAGAGDLEVLPDEEKLHRALVLGRDYVRKCGFKSVVLGLSRGLTRRSACLAVAALGREQVRVFRCLPTSRRRESGRRASAGNATRHRL